MRPKEIDVWLWTNLTAHSGWGQLKYKNNNNKKKTNKQRGNWKTRKLKRHSQNHTCGMAKGTNFAQMRASIPTWHGHMKVTIIHTAITFNFKIRRLFYNKLTAFLLINNILWYQIIVLCKYLKLRSLLLPGFLSETIVPLDFSANATRDAARAGI